MERLKKILTNVLVAFVLISIGFVAGKHSAESHRPASNVTISNGHRVVVYYLHSSFRCASCNTIEKMTRELLDTAYSKQLAGGEIQWVEDDFQKNETLANQFEVVASCVVVADVEDGVVLEHKRLDDVWTKMKNQQDFDQYISQAIDGYLRDGEVEL